MTLDLSRTAVVAVDLQQDCISQNGSWPILNGDSLVTNAEIALEACRAKGLPIIYTQHWLDPRGIDALLHEPVIDGRPTHGIAGQANSAFHPRLLPRERDIIVRKQRWSGFHQTNLDLILRRMDVKHLIMFGVWTEACFETTVWDAIARDYRITIVKDACATATELMHMTAILDLANWLYDGAILKAEDLAQCLRGEPHRIWHFDRPAAFAYTLENISELYASI